VAGGDRPNSSLLSVASTRVIQFRELGTLVVFLMFSVLFFVPRVILGRSRLGVTLRDAEGGKNDVHGG
jgi:hypothetical protein